ncbi:MAG: alcohol dehydrogenase catalytic domain-containing protein [Candidatus Rokubacteria bacterium]|nr:alcohol dehydrogenase catalytic domain-containing protein [Candidatus Rokubacteria bacterium]
MKALVYPAHGQIEVRDVPEPAPPGPGEVLVRVAAAGICGSELEAFVSRSPRRPPPLIMGHEFCGQVSAVGPGVADLRPGDRVVMNSLISCGACESCREGRPHLCPRREVFGMRRPGGWAELTTVPASTVFHLPEKVSPIEGALVEPLANAVHVFSLVEARLPETVVVIGTGTIGLMCLQVARALGALRLVAVDTNGFRLEVAHRLGAEPVVNPRERPLRDVIGELTRGRGADVVVDAAGTLETRREAVAVARPGGEVVWIGLHADDTALSGQEVVLGERRISGSYAVTPRDLRTAIGLLAHGRVEVAPWARPFPLADGARVFRELLSQPPDYIKAVLVP